ncbi:MAG: serine protease [Chloroflexi bacterium]|nr:serine protease [Chloroflexota bacterium]
MPTWGEILAEIKESARTDGSPDFDSIRRRYLQGMHHVTGRASILYATAWLEPTPISPAELQISLADVQGFMEAVSNIDERELDLIVHSPGGSAEAAESLVEYLRERFDHIRVFVPVAAMSAATMIALSADEVVMGQHSQLGPIDPQFIISTPEGPRSAPAKAILNQFELAKDECKEPENLAAWMPILRTYSPGLLTQCNDSRSLASTMVAGWLERYMLSAEEGAVSKAQCIADWFAEYDSFQSHSRRVGRDEARQQGVKIRDLEEDGNLQDVVLSVHHATMHTFGSTGAHKIIENHHGRSWVRMSRPLAIPGVRDPADGESG